MATWRDHFRARRQEVANLTTATPPTFTPLPVSRPPDCTDDAHGALGWWHTEDGRRFCTAWACQPGQKGSSPSPAPPAARCSDQNHRGPWLIVGGRAICPEHGGTLSPDDGAPAA
jgi:hypothetical protein